MPGKGTCKQMSLENWVLRDPSKKSTSSLRPSLQRQTKKRPRETSPRPQAAFTTNLEVNAKHLKAQRGVYAQLFHRSSYRTRVSEKNQEKGHSSFPLEDAAFE